MNTSLEHLNGKSIDFLDGYITAVRDMCEITFRIGKIANAEFDREIERMQEELCEK